MVTVRAEAGPGCDLPGMVGAAFRQIARVHARMSFHDPASELSLLNREARGRSIRVSPDTWAVLSIAKRMFVESGGLFDVTVAPELARWGYLPRVARASRSATMNDVEMGTGRTVRFRRPLVVDLGGIAKGYAVDLAVRALVRAGASRGSVNAGGDLRVFGDRSETVHIRHPGDLSASIPVLELRDAAVATSATYFTRRRVAGRLLSPIVHPLTHRPCRARSSVSVVAVTCVIADALTKVVLLAGEQAFPLLRRFLASAAIIAPDGRVLHSESQAHVA
jgi:thiamine biosynthesis lipoprotein